MDLKRPRPMVALMMTLAFIQASFPRESPTELRAPVGKQGGSFAARSQAQAAPPGPRTPARTVQKGSAAALPSRPVPAAGPGANAAPFMLRVGLSTAGGKVQLWSPGPLTITDPNQPGRKLNVAENGTLAFTAGAVQKVEEPPAGSGRVWTGNLTVTTPAGTSRGWSAFAIQVGGSPARLTSDGKDPRWGRPYRGNFEIYPQRAAEPNHRKGDLTVVNVVSLEEYLYGVVPWEMSPSAPLEALKAQAICARTKTLDFVASRRFASGGFDVCDYDACQGYPGTENEKPSTTLAVDQTAGLALFHNNRPIDAVYSTNSGGITANASDVWNSSSPVPYLRSVTDMDPRSEPRAASTAKWTEEDWREFCSRPWASYAMPDDATRKALEARRARSAFAARLFGPDDWPEFYRWQRTVTVEEVTKALNLPAGSVITALEVAQRTNTGRVRQLQVRAYPPLVAKRWKAKRAATPHLLASRQRPGNAGQPGSGQTGSGQAGGAQPAGAGQVPVPESGGLPPGQGGEVVQQTWQGDGAVRSFLSKRLGSTTALPSSLFTVEPQVNGDGQLTGWLLRGAGWGHGVGMCQRGAQNRARAGWDARKILSWYYRDVQIKRLDER